MTRTRMARVFAVAVAFLALAPAAASATPPPNQLNIDYRGCDLQAGETLPNGSNQFVCQQYANGNFGKVWSELDLVPHRVTITDTRTSGAARTYNLAVAADALDGGFKGYDVISGPAKNGGLSTGTAGNCAITVGAQQTATPGVGGTDSTIYRIITITQSANSECTFDWFQRLALGASKFPGASLHSYLLNDDLDASGVGKQALSMPANSQNISPQELRKDMSAVQDASHPWNVTKESTPANINFDRPCDPTARQANVNVRVEWQRLPAVGTGDVLVVTNIYVRNPAARTIDVQVQDVIRSGATPLDTFTTAVTPIPANAEVLVATHSKLVPANQATNLNDIATATYTDPVLNDPVPGSTSATATATVQTGGTVDTTATVHDEETITGTGLSFRVDSVDAGSASGTFTSGPGTLGSALTLPTADFSATSPPGANGTISWTSGTQNGDGFVDFNKTVSVAGDITTSGTLSDVATVTGSNSFSTSDDASTSISSSKCGTIKIKKLTEPAGGGPFDFSSDISGSSTFSLGDTQVREMTVEPGDYDVTEAIPADWDLESIVCDDNTQPAGQKSVGDPATGKADISLQSGETVECVYTNAERGKIVIDKSTLPSGASQPFSFTSPDLVAAGHTGPFEATDANSATFDVKPGTYAVAEDGESSWRLSDLTCTDGDQNRTPSTVDKGTGKATYQVDPGETVTCTFENTKDGKVVIDKSTLPAGSGQVFSFTSPDLVAGGNAGPFEATDANSSSFNVKPGTYGVTEDGETDWRLTDLNCTDGDQNGTASTVDKGAEKATYRVDPGETVTCTYENTKDGKVVIDKSTLPAGSGQVFSFTSPDLVAAGNAGPLEATDAANASFDVKPGSYSVTEDDETDWRLTDLDCTDGDQNGTTSTVDKGSGKATYKVDPGETVTCTFENTKDGKVVIDKSTLPAGSSQVFSFASSDLVAAGHAGPFEATDANSSSFDVKPGTYVVTEDGEADWRLTDLSCTDGDQNGTASSVDKPTGKATYKVDPGETVTCTFQNTKDGKVVIDKSTLPSGASQVFSFTSPDLIAAGHAGPFEATDGTSASFDVKPGTYAVTEDGESDWRLTDLDCTDGDQNGITSTVDKATQRATYKVDPGETVTCTFENTKDGKVVIDKNTLPAGSSQVFSFASPDLVAEGHAGPFEATDANSASFDVKPGTYGVTEDGETDWRLTDLDCTDGAQNGTASSVDKGSGKATYRVDPGETVTCTFENTKDGKVVIDKNTLPSGASQVFSFTSPDLVAQGHAGPFEATDANSASFDVKPGTYVVGEDGESGWRLTDLSCTDGDQNGTTSTVDKGTSNATYKVDPGETVTCTFENTNDGKIVIDKKTLPSGASQVFSFTSPDLVADGHAGPFEATDANNASFDVKPGTYAVTEDGETGWRLTDLDCTDGDQNGITSTVDKASGKATYKVDPGETVTCTYENTKDGKVVIDKNTLPSGASQVFSFASPDLVAEGHAGPFEATDAANASFDVKPGTYVVTEDGETDWRLTDLSCTDGDQNGTTSSIDKASGKATYKVDPGETVTCTYENTKDGKVVIDKNTLPSGASQTFSFTSSDLIAAGHAGPFEATDANTASFGVKPGTYAVTEDGETGWRLTDLDCTDGDQNGSSSSVDKGTQKATYRVDPGETVTCTYENTKDGKVVIDKNTLPTGSNQVFSFTSPDLVADGHAAPFEATDANNASFDVKPGTYAVTEDGESGWRLTDLSCSDSARNGTTSTVDKGSGKATYNVDPGETVTCTYENTKDGKLVIDKSTLPAGSNQAFSFTSPDLVAEGHAGPFEATDATNASFGVKPGSYAVTEDGETGWRLNDLSCTDGDQNGAASTVDKGTSKATYKVDPGETVTCTFQNTNDGKVVIDKNTLPAGSNQVFSFASPDLVAEGHAGPFEATDANSASFDVKPGTYVVTEDGETDWRLTDLDCTDGDQNGTSSTVDKGTSKATYKVDPGETVTCTFENTKDGKVVIDKNTLPAGSSQVFSFASPDLVAEGHAGPFEATDATNASFDVKPGTYAVTEDGETDWRLTDLDCTDGDQNGAASTVDKGSRKATYKVDPGETVTCTFENTKDGKVVIDKNTLPAGSGEVFSFTSSELVAAGAGAITATHAQDFARGVSPGTYNVTENGKSGWQLTDLDCDDTARGGTASTVDKAARKATYKVDPGETVTCTFENTRDARLIVEQKTIPPGADQQFEFETPGLPDALFVLLGGQNGGSSLTAKDGDSKAADVAPGSYAVTQKVVDDWPLTSLTCDDGQSVSVSVPVLGDRKATFKVEPGETVKCTWTNTRRETPQSEPEPRIAIDKQAPATATAGDLLDFTLIVTNPGTVPFPADGVVVNDPRCVSAPVLQARNRGAGTDPTPGTLDPGDSWIYTCSGKSQSGDREFVNTATVTGTAGGQTATASDTTTTALSEQQVEGERVTPGSARLAGPSGCRAKPFTVRVKGRSIARVIFSIDGKRRKTVSTPDRAGRYLFKIDPRRFKAGGHRLTTRVEFLSASRTRPKTMRLRFSRCVKAAGPAFTG